MSDAQDYIEALFLYDGKTRVKYVSSLLIKGRRLALYGIAVALVQHGRSTKVNPVIPAIGALIEIARDNPSCSAFNWNDSAWEPVTAAAV